MASPVSDFYLGKNLLVTGVTGFLGKALVEKLLRCCDVGTIFLLIRQKHGRSLQERLDHLISNPVFARLKEEKGESVFTKLVPIDGDINAVSLGLSTIDRQQLADKVNLVFHSAATLDFALDLKEVVTANLGGTKCVLDLCKQMKNLECLVYVSSAYVNANREHAEEILYPQHMTAEELTAIVTHMKREDSAAITKTVLKDHPNSYTISKALAEVEITTCRGNFPSVIVRPSMIVNAWRDPVPGWSDSKNGPQGFFTGAALGVVRRLPMDRNLVNDYIPVDVVVNQLIVTGWHAATTRPTETLVYHCTSSTRKPFTWGVFDKDDKINKTLRLYPVQSAVWYPNLQMVPNFTLFRVTSLLFHFLPALFFDSLLSLSGGKPRLFRLHYKIDTSLSLLAPFIFKEWFFDSKKTEQLHQNLTDKDKELFYVDIETIDYDDFFSNAILGARKYLNREEMNTLPAARRKLRVLYLLNLSVQAAVICFLWWLLAAFLALPMLDLIWTLPIVYVLFSLV